jgi:hypothetical protein
MRVSVLLNNGNGTFRAAVNYNAGPVPFSLAVSDFNGDGKPDLALDASGGVVVLLGRGDGTFQIAVNYGAGGHPFFVAVGDFNNDGKPDLVVANLNSADVSVFSSGDKWSGCAARVHVLT